MRTFIASIPALLWFLSQIMIVGKNSCTKSHLRHTLYVVGGFGVVKLGWLGLGSTSDGFKNLSVTHMMNHIGVFMN